jgi:tRNA(fMet)-specific endonuclease VapC
VIILDTDTCIEILRGNRQVIERRAAYTKSVAVSFMTAGELFYGAARSEDAARNRSLVETFLLTLKVIEGDLDIMRRFGDLKGSLARGGALLSDADILIAATTLEMGEGLVTGNTRHFERVPGLKLENWIR